MEISLLQFSEERFGHAYLPYSVGLLQSYVQAHAREPERYHFRPLIYARQRIEALLPQLRGSDLVGLSLYIWNVERSLATAQALKAEAPQTLIVMGGPQVPDQAEAFLRKYPFVDLVTHGEGEQLFLDILEMYPERNWADLAGVSWVDSEGVFHHRPPGPRIQDLSQLPSPYLSGVFLPLLEQAPEMEWIGTWESNRGCPFSCSFCDWGSLIQSKVYRIPMARLEAEIDWFAEHAILDLFCADANFGMLERDLALAQYLADTKKRTGKPRLFQMQTAKNVRSRTLEIQKILSESGLNPVAAISLQSLDAETLHHIQRENISLSRFQEMLQFCLAQGIFTYTDLILGLPGESYDSFASGLGEMIRLGQHNRIFFHNAALLPNAQMAQPDYRQRHGIESVAIPFPGQGDIDEIEEKMEIIVATSRLSRPDWVKMHVLAWTSNLLYFTHKPLQIIMMVLHALTGLSYRQLIEVFTQAEYLRHYPLLQQIHKTLAHSAEVLQQGRPQSENPAVFTLEAGIQVTPELLAQMRLHQNKLWPRFFAEAGHLLTRLALQHEPEIALDIVREALDLSQHHFYHLFYGESTAYRQGISGVSEKNLTLRYNLWDFYQAQLRGESLQIQLSPQTLRFWVPIHS